MQTQKSTVRGVAIISGIPGISQVNRALNHRKELRESFSAIRPYLNRTLLFSLATGMLVLTPSWYMMEVYDRVVNSRNHQTLLMLTLMVAGLYAMLEGLEWVRSMVMHEAGVVMDKRLRNRVFDALFTARLRNAPAGRSVQALTDLRTLHDLLPSPVFLAAFDAPLALLVAVILFFMNPLLCWFALAGALFQVLIGFFNEQRIRKPMEEANRHMFGAQLFAGGVLRNTRVIEAMGMLDDLRGRWLVHQRAYLSNQAQASDTAGANAALSKLAQSLLASLLLGAGCWLTLKGEL